MLPRAVASLVIGASYECHLLRRFFFSFSRLFHGFSSARPFSGGFLLSFSRRARDIMQTALVAWIGERKFVATSPSGHSMVFDSDRQSNKAPGSMETLLMALGSCTATDVVIILQKKRQKLESLEVICSGERGKEAPEVWTKLELFYRLRGELDDAAVKHAIELSEGKYCSVSAMLKKSATLTWHYEILPATK
jgi:putative redox protein